MELARQIIYVSRFSCFSLNSILNFYSLRRKKTVLKKVVNKKCGRTHRIARRDCFLVLSCRP